ncbi:MAG: hypothetical protein ACFFA8_05805 [Promethearchaeota archaeon]
MFENVMKAKIIVIVSIILGIIISLITGLIPYPTTSIIGIQKWGYPFYWLSKPIYPDAVVNITWAFLIFDILFWILISLILIEVFSLLLKKIKKS